MQTFEPSKKGDLGTTAMFGGRVKKSSKSVKFVGAIDTLQAKFGELYADCYAETGIFNKHKTKIDILAVIVNDLYNINSILWSPRVVAFDVTLLDDLLTKLPFDLPQGFQLPLYDDPMIAKMNTLRCEVRSAELTLIDFMESDEYLDNCSKLQMKLLSDSLAYLNRLSSVMYAMMNFYNRSPTVMAVLAGKLSSE